MSAINHNLVALIDLYLSLMFTDQMGEKYHVRWATRVPPFMVVVSGSLFWIYKLFIDIKEIMHNTSLICNSSRRWSIQRVKILEWQWVWVEIADTCRSVNALMTTVAFWMFGKAGLIHEKSFNVMLLRRGGFLFLEMAKMCIWEM